jgi:hypothetical protein
MIKSEYTSLLELAKDMEQEVERLKYSTMISVMELAPIMRDEMETVANTSIKEDDRKALVDNHFRTKTTKHTFKLQMINDNQQATYAEYGYGIVGGSQPYQNGDIFGGDAKIGWKGYDLDSYHKDHYERFWWHKGMMMWGFTQTPAFFKTYMFLLSNGQRIIGEKIRSKFKW